MSSYEMSPLFVPGSLLVFAIIVLWMMSSLIKKDKPAGPILRTFGTLLIIVAAVFLVVVGYGEAQIAPVMGLLGTVAGYLLGKSERPVCKYKPPETTPVTVQGEPPKPHPSSGAVLH